MRAVTIGGGGYAAGIGATTVARIARLVADARRQRVTIRHLLTHSSGLPAHVNFRDEVGAAAVIGRVCATPLIAAPGDAVLYTAIGADGQVQEAHSISAGLDYPGVGPQLAALALDGRLELANATDTDALAATRHLAACEGILPALESAHALAALPDLLAGLDGRTIVLVGLSGRGDKDVGHLAVAQ